MKRAFTFLFKFCLILLISSCSHDVDNSDEPQESLKSLDTDKIQVLNFGTFHFGFTTDREKEDFDENSAENIKAAKEVASLLAEFKPTVIVVEQAPENDDELIDEYLSYLAKPDTIYPSPTETELLAFEIGRLSGANKIHGIDHVVYYNYRMDEFLENTIDSATTKAFRADPYEHFLEAKDKDSELDLKSKLINRNRPKYLDFMMTLNADILTHVGTDGNFEGADEAAKFYQRNLRMYSNLNRIPLTKNDRVFILMGAAHTAFFRDFLSRSPKYETVNVLDYLK